MQKKVQRKKIVETVEPAAEVQVATPVSKRSEKNQNTYIILFKTDGDPNYKMNPFKTKEALDVYIKNQPGHPVMIEKKWFVFDRINGTITPEK